MSGLMLTASRLTSGLAYLFNVHAVKEWTVYKLEGAERKKRNEQEREGLPCCCASIGCPFSPDASASNAVAMGNQGAGSRPVHQRLHCTGWQLSSSPSLSPCLSPRSCMPSSSASKRRSRMWTTSTWGAGRSWSKLRTSSPESSSSSEWSPHPKESAGSANTAARLNKQSPLKSDTGLKRILLIRTVTDKWGSDNRYIFYVGTWLTQNVHEFFQQCSSYGISWQVIPVCLDRAVHIPLAKFCQNIQNIQMELIKLM